MISRRSWTDDYLCNFKKVRALLNFEMASINCNVLAHVGWFLSWNQLRNRFHHLVCEDHWLLPWRGLTTIVFVFFFSLLATELCFFSFTVLDDWGVYEIIHVLVWSVELCCFKSGDLGYTNISTSSACIRSFSLMMMMRNVY